MRYSIRKQMSCLFIGLMICLLAGNGIINNFFLEKYYIHKKEIVLINAYNTINQVDNPSVYQSEEFAEELSEICSLNNITLVLLNNSLQEIGSTNDYNSTVLSQKLIGYVYSLDVSQAKIITTTENYTVQQVDDKQNKSGSLEIWGILDNDCFFAMAIPVQSIRGNVKISNEFLSYLSIVGIILSSVVVWWISRKITAPIQELTVLSQCMAGMDFDIRYESKEKNEIGLLGEHFNKMSSALKKTIAELKTANNELKKDIEKKEEIDEMRKEFLANVSHELKTPIALIQGYAEGLNEYIDEDVETRDFYCDVIIDEAGKMNQMVKKLLTLNQLEFGNDAVQMEQFNITDLINGVVQSVGILAQQKGITIQFSQSEPCHVWADEFKTEEVVTNYISNAINHAADCKVIDIKLTGLDNRVRISVFNTGSPIPEADLDQIWDKFYKVDKARTRDYGGSGIGLSIVKAIIDSFHQECGVINYDNGVEFWFELEGEIC